ncbi:DMT family transporter [Pseudoalteromonas tunicata]|uniref:DMT family transporter n=1 Tax=Pseudoalteromonas tunicata TaxID=314281 RepID=UPI0027401FD8|nr:DMT family transporter [Pseudoalteromonas tunicata]MDP5213417.1 DMT family transporter [Pseudoalteromonas tunicata]
MNLFALLALSAGACIALQAAMNAQLGQLLGSPLLATSFAFLSSFALVSTVAYFNQYGTTNSALNLSQVPWFLWCSCIFSVIGVASFYFLIPKLGVGNVMSFALAGQLMLSIVISHFGWFESPIKHIDGQKILGIIFMIAALVLINKEFK